MIGFVSLAYKNLRRKKVRSFLTIGGVAIAVAVLVSLLGFNSGYKRALTNDIDRMGYQVLITAKGCPYEAATMMLKGSGGMRYMEQEIYDQIVNDPRIDKIAPQLMHSAYRPDADGGRGSMLMYMGIMRSYLELKPWIEFESGGWFSAADADEVILGYAAAEAEQRSVGDEVTIPGVDKVLKVAAVLERTGSQDDGMLFLPLAASQRLFKVPGKLTGIGIKLKQLEKLAEFEESLYHMASIQVVSMAQVKGTIFNLISSAQVLVTSVAVIAIFVAVIGVVNTILMSVFERTQEIGVIKAIGASKLDVFKLIWVETVLVCALGGIAGSALAVLGGNAVEYFIKQVLPYAPEGRLVFITLRLLVLSFLGTIVLGLLSGIYPAFKAASMRPIEAIRQGE